MEKISKTLYWTPRILSIIFILFLAMFSLDVFGNGYSFWETIVGLLMHNIPVFVLAILLWLSWKREWVGAITFVLAGILYIVLLVISSINSGKFEWYIISWSMTLAGPAFIIGYLFWLDWKKRK